MSAPPTNDAPSDFALRVADLRSAERTFDIAPDAGVLREIALELDLLSLKKLRFRGTLRPKGATDWSLEGKLGATVEQPCGVTLAPVRTRIETDVARAFVKNFESPEAPEAEMPEDDSVEALTAWIDLRAVLTEALSLELPAYPRAEGTEFDVARFAEDGVRPMTDEDARPFAVLKGLKDEMDKKS